MYDAALSTRVATLCLGDAGFLVPSTRSSASPTPALLAPGTPRSHRVRLL